MCEMQYTKEYIEYVKQYPVVVEENCCNGIKNETVFKNKYEALIYIEKEKIKHKGRKYTLIENKLNPKYI